MTEQRGPLRPEPARELAEADDAAADRDLDYLDAADDVDATRPIPELTENPDRPAERPAVEWHDRDRDGNAEPVGAVSGPAAGALDRRHRIDTGSEWFWPVVTAIGVAIVLLMNWLANAIPFNDQSTGEVITKDPTVFQPAGWAFAIWGLIYLAMLVFVVYFFLPMGRRNPFVQRIAPWLLVANIANVFWLLAWHYELFPLAMALILVLLGSLAGAYTILHWRRKGEREASKPERYLAWPLVSIYLGWISVASMANAVLLMDRRNWQGPFSLEWWSVILLLVAIGASAFFGFLRRDAAYPLVIAFASIAITVEVWDRSALVAVFALITAIVAAACAIVGSLMAFDRRAMLGMYSTKRGQDAPTA